MCHFHDEMRHITLCCFTKNARILTNWFEYELRFFMLVLTTLYFLYALEKTDIIGTYIHVVSKEHLSITLR